jgi:AcrR family transcriptional regulator
MNALRSKEEVVEEFRIQTILDAAMRVIARKGLANASMQEIASEAGIAKGTIYLYFQNQQELLERTVDAALSRLLTGLEGVLESDLPFRSRMEAFLRIQLEFLDSHQQFFRVLAASRYPVGTQPSRCTRTERPQYQHYHRKFSAFLSQAMEGGAVRSMDPDRLATFIEEGVYSVLMQRLGEEASPPLDEDVEWMTGVVMNGIGAREA